MAWETSKLEELDTCVSRGVSDCAQMLLSEMAGLMGAQEGDQKSGTGHLSGRLGQRAFAGLWVTQKCSGYNAFLCTRVTPGGLGTSYVIRWIKSRFDRPCKASASPRSIGPFRGRGVSFTATSISCFLALAVGFLLFTEKQPSGTETWAGGLRGLSFEYRRPQPCQEG